MVKKTGSSVKEVSTHKSDWIDISIPLSDDMVQSPMEPITAHFEYIFSREKGNGVTMTHIYMLSHTGTHIDAPYYLFEEGETIDDMPLDTAIGPARVIEIKDAESIKPEELAAYNIEPGERLLFKTRNSSRAERTKKLFKDNVYFTLEALHFLAKKKVRVIGIDYLTISNGNVEYVDPDAENDHDALFKNGIYVIEDLDLSGVKPGRYEMVCLPLRLKRGDAAPARAIIRPI